MAKKSTSEGPQQPNSCRSRDECHKFLNDRFPGRKDQIDDLLCIMGEPCDAFPPLLLYGSPATGKTSVLKETLSFLNRPFAYVSCRSCHSPRLVFESVLNQLLGHVRSRANNYASARKCERLTDFVTQLVEACAPKGLGSRISGIIEEKIYVIFDNVELIRGWASGNNLMSSLLKLSDLTRLPNLGLIFVSNSGPDTFHPTTAGREPIPLFFKDYSNQELYQILTKWQPNSDLYSFFLKSSLAPFSRASRKVTELSEGLHPLFLKFCEPVLSGKVVLNEQGKRELYRYVKHYIQPALGQSLVIADPGKSINVHQEWKSLCSTRPSAEVGVGFHLSLCGKYLLLAVYIASRNPSTLDDALFGSGEGLLKSNKRRRRSSTSAMDKEEAIMQEKHLKGPSICPLERLLAIFQCIATDSSTEKVTIFQLPSAEEEHVKDITSNVQMELVTLTSVNLILKTSSSPLEGLAKFRANVNTDFINQVARSINFPLDKYLLHA